MKDTQGNCNLEILLIFDSPIRYCGLVIASGHQSIRVEFIKFMTCIPAMPILNNLIAPLNKTLEVTQKLLGAPAQVPIMLAVD